MIKPTIGRIVWYTPHVHEPDPDRGEQKLAAIVVHVHDDHHINIAGWTSDGTPFRKRMCYLIQPDDVGAAPSSDYCEWMPFQIGAAKQYQFEQEQGGKPAQD